MGRCCAAYGCSNRQDKTKDISFHVFPKDPERREKWVRALRRDNFSVKPCELCPEPSPSVVED